MLLAAEHDRAKDRRVRGIEFIEASTLICTELLRARAAAKICIEEKHWWTVDLQPTTKAWQNCRPAIARELSLTGWSAVISGFEALKG
jgi:hypothetical protein